ncbi:MAG: helix-turn-helix transcriptional regulator [Brevinematales bacterium]|nr:helix-turn-helix transcriptional regulator [Brevinematales bacterium]
MAVLLLAVHLTSVVVGFIVLFMSIFICLRFKIRDLAFFIALQFVLIVHLSIVIAFREGINLGWTITESQIYLLKRMVYLLLSLIISIVYLLFSYLVYRPLQRWRWIGSGVLQILYTLIIFSPVFEIPATRTPLWGYYAFNFILSAQFIWTYRRIFTKRKFLDDKNMIRISNIFLVISPMAMLYYYFLELSGRFFLVQPVSQGYSLPIPLLFILANIAVILYGFTRFTVKPMEISGTSFDNPGMTKKYGLSEREAEIMKYLCKGLSNKETGKKLFISELTVKTHVRNIYRKLGIKNRLELLDKVSRFKE